MYGTIARCRVLPGQLDLLRAWANRAETRPVPGFVETVVYQMDADPNEVMLAVVFESREAYHANAASPTQHADFLAMRALLEADPEWHDGEIIWRGGPHQ